MGKTKVHKRKQRNKILAGIPSVKDPKEEELELSGKRLASVYRGKTAIKAIIEQLQGSPEDKIFGLNSLASVFDKRPSIEEVMQNRIVRIAAPLLLDNNPVVRHIAAGALRNLSACTDPNVCELLVQQDIMTPLTALIQKYAEDWQDIGGKKLVSEHTQTFIEAVHLLLNLCESNSTALTYFNERNLLIVLSRCLDHKNYGIDTSVAVAQCLQTVTENNPEAIKVLQNMESTWHSLLELEENNPQFLLFRALCCGLVLNIRANIRPAIVLGVLGAVLDVDHCKVLSTLATTLADFKEDEVPAEDANKLEQREKAAAEVLSLLEAQQTSLEILANVCSGEDDEDEMEVDSSDMSDHFLSDSSSPDDDPSTYQACPLTIPAEVHEAVSHHNLVEKTWSKIRLPADDVYAILEVHPEASNVCKRIGVLRCRALLCLNNLLQCLDVKDFNGCDGLFKMWVDMTTLLSVSEDSTLVEALTAAMRAVLEKAAPLEPNCFSNISQSELKYLFNWLHGCGDPGARVNLVKIIGMLGLILKSQSALKTVGTFLLELASKEGELWVLAEIFDTIIDMFAEDDTDLAAAEISLVERLKGLIPGLKHKVRAKRKCLGEHYIMITTVCTNLNRFVEYKGKRIALIQHRNGHN